MSSLAGIVRNSGNLFRMARGFLNRPPYSVSADGKGITQRRSELFQYRLLRREPWDEIVAIYGQKREMITYEQNYLLLENQQGNILWVGELDLGFREVEQEIRLRYPVIDKNWRAQLEISPAGISFPLWAPAGLPVNS